MEELFVLAAAETLPASSAEISRSDGGRLVYHWNSPCEPLAGLWVSVSAREVMLSTKISHMHVDQTDFWRDEVPEPELPKRIVEQAVKEADQILAGDTVFIKTFSPEGREVSSGGIAPRSLWMDPQERLSWAAFFGEGYVARAWDWFGEVTDD